MITPSFSYLAPATPLGGDGSPQVLAEGPQSEGGDVPQ